MEAVGATASVIAIATLAWQSSKAAYNVIDGLVEAPAIVEDSKRRLLETGNTLEFLQAQLTARQTQSLRSLDALLEQIQLKSSLELTNKLCDEFKEKLSQYTQHSTDSKFSSRDRLAVDFHGAKIRKFNDRLGDCHLGITVILGSINLILSSQISDNIDGLADRIASQEKTLIKASQQLEDSRQSLKVLLAPETVDDPNSFASEAGSRLIAELEEACKRTHDIAKATRTKQKFGNMTLDKSIGMQGIVGKAQEGVEQGFGDLTASNESKGFQGQLDGASFSKMFG